MTIFGVSATLAAALAPVLGVGMLAVASSDATNYTMLFLVGAVIALSAPP
jgi:hypothetical protein